MTEKKHQYPTQPSLVGAKVYLRPLTPDDLVNLHYWSVRSEPQSMSSRPRDFRTAAEVAEGYRKADRSPDTHGFAVVRKKENALVGLVRFFNLNTLNRSAELGLMIDPDERKKGYGADAIKVLSSFLFHYRGLNKVYAMTAGFNGGAVALLESLGFKRDATLRDHFFYKGQFHPGYIYSLLLFEVAQ